MNEWMVFTSITINNTWSCQGQGYWFHVCHIPLHRRRQLLTVQQLHGEWKGWSCGRVGGEFTGTQAAGPRLLHWPLAQLPLLVPTRYGLAQPPTLESIVSLFKHRHVSQEWPPLWPWGQLQLCKHMCMCAYTLYIWYTGVLWVCVCLTWRAQLQIFPSWISHYCWLYALGIVNESLEAWGFSAIGRWW